MAGSPHYENNDHGGNYDPNQHTSYSQDHTSLPPEQPLVPPLPSPHSSHQQPAAVTEHWVPHTNLDHGGNYDPNRPREQVFQQSPQQWNQSSRSLNNQLQQGAASNNGVIRTVVSPPSTPEPSYQSSSHRTLSSHGIERRPVGPASPRQMSDGRSSGEPRYPLQKPESTWEEATVPSSLPMSAVVTTATSLTPINQQETQFSTSWRPKGERGYQNFGEDSILRWKFPNSVRLPNITTKDSTGYHHLDFLSRPFAGIRDDRYISPWDTHVSKLVVQCSQDVYDAMPEGTWRRTFVRNNCPLLVRIACWATNSLPEDRQATGEDWGIAIAKWIPASIALIIISWEALNSPGFVILYQEFWAADFTRQMTFPVQVAGSVRNNGKYDGFHYKDWSYPYDARNRFESHEAWTRNDQNTALRGALTNATIEKLVEPNYLCFLSDDDRIEICSPAAWRRKKGKNVNTEYVLVSYTSKQFPTENDWDYLHRVGKHAAKAAKVAAYWVGCSCLGDKPEVEKNVWTICDVLRRAHSLVIAVSGASSIDSQGGLPRELLRDWGSRVWTWPEILLNPGHKDIDIYRRGVDFKLRTTISRRNFPSLWDDAPISGSLVDHYEGSLILGPLELVTTALRCLHNRETQEHLPGDMSYALMGLLSKRPNVVPKDSAFQAFARLSLANDSNMLLERMICVLPKTPFEPWHSLEDQWGVSLWDIYPKTQVCGIGENDIVILDGARSASIRWKAFARVITLQRENWKRTIARMAMRSMSYIFFLGVALIATGAQFNLAFSISNGGLSEGGSGPGTALETVGGIILGVALLLSFASPYLIRSLYTGKVWGAQPWLFGIEGYMDIHDLERHIFGIDLGHLKWSVAGSPLSRHRATTLGEGKGAMRNIREGVDPLSDPATSVKCQKALRSSVNEEKIFTLVDTYTMTATIFSALRPPVAAVMCGEEGGMQRAVLCSYDWTSQTLYRETVVRMETPAWEMMDPVGRIKLGLQRNSGSGASA